jgi:hypothetical protein
MRKVIFVSLSLAFLPAGCSAYQSSPGGGQREAQCC